MLKIIGVRFKSVGKIYYFDPKDYDVKMGDKVIVETARGVECGEVALVDREIDETRFTNPVKGIIRLATPNDMKTIEKNRQKEKDAFKICEQKIAAHKLKMNLIDVECTFAVSYTHLRAHETRDSFSILPPRAELTSVSL